MIFRRHPRWTPKRPAPRLLPSYLRNPSHPRLPSVLPCSRRSNFQQLNYPTRMVHPERSEGSLYFQQLTRCLKFATLSELLCFQSLPTIKFSKSRVLITIRIAGGWGVSPGAVGVKVILELRQAERRGPSEIVYLREGYPGPSSLESTLTSLPASVASKGLPGELTRLESTLTQKQGGGGGFSSFAFRVPFAKKSTPARRCLPAARRAFPWSSWPSSTTE